MPDTLTPEQRSHIMSRIRSENTSPELLVFRYLRSEKIYFQKHYKRVKGCPDIALPRKRKAVFIDGDFWHGKNLDSRRDRLPKYWVDKISRNIERDKENRAALRQAGWQVLEVWESDLTKDPERHLEMIKNFLQR